MTATQAPSGTDTAPARQGSAPRWRTGLASLLEGRGAVLLPLAAAALVLLIVPGVLSDLHVREVALIAVYALITSGLTLSFGFAGEVQFGQVAFFAAGAYVTAFLSVNDYLNDIVLLMIISGVAACILGAVVAIPGMRLSGWSLAMTSFFLLTLLPSVLSIIGDPVGGVTGLFGLNTPTVFGVALGPRGLAETCVVVLIVWLAFFRNLVTSHYGHLLRIVREGPVLAQSLGYSPQRIKVATYVIGAFPAGVAGCLFAFVSLIVAPGSFGLEKAIAVVAAAILGGVESVYGPVLGAAILQLGLFQSSSFSDYSFIAYGAFLVIAGVLFRQGVSGICLNITGRLAAALRTGSWRRNPEATPPLRRSDEPTGPAGWSLEGQLLEVDGATKRFGGVRALDAVKLSARPGRVTAVVGANGSGKTTLLNSISGFVRVDSGSLRLGETELTRLNPRQAAAHAGVARTFQTPMIPRGLTVAEVVASGRYHARRCGPVASVLRLPRYWRTRREDREAALRALRLVQLEDLADRVAGDLPLGRRRLVEVARAVCAEPSILLLDEPASGLSPQELTDLGSVIERVAGAGATVILVEHNLKFVMGVAADVFVLESGARIASGTPREVVSDETVVASFLGEYGKALIAPDGATRPTGVVGATATTGAALPSSYLVVEDPADTAATPMLEVSGLVSGYRDLQVLRGVSLSVAAGRLTLVLGRNGVGKTTLLSAVAGLLPTWEGSIHLDGVDITRTSASRRADVGMSIVLEGKRIFRQRTVVENLIVGAHSQHLGRRQLAERTEAVLGRLPLLGELRGRVAGSLSGGQQEILAIGQALMADPKVLLLDEPSAGLSPAAVEDLLEILRQLKAEGRGIVLVEQIVDRAIPVADHVVLIDQGAVVADGPPSVLDRPEVVRSSYFGTA